MILYIENPKDATRKPLELINAFGKIFGYKIHTQKPLAFLYTNNERWEREIKETIPFTITSTRIKYLEINLPKEAKDLYLENCKILMRQSEESAITKMCHEKYKTLSNKVKGKKEQSWRNQASWP